MCSLYSLYTGTSVRWPHTSLHLDCFTGLHAWKMMATLPFCHE